MDPDVKKLIQDAVEAGSFDKVEPLCRQILAIEPNNVQALVLLGKAATESGRVPLGLQVLRQALMIDPNNYDALNWFAIAHKQNGQVPEAIAFCERAITLAPERQDAYATLGLCLQAQFQPELAEKNLRKALEIGPETASIWHNLGSALHLQARDAEAIGAYEKAISLAPDVPNSYISLGQILRNQDRVDEAGQYFRRARQTVANSPVGLVNLARALKDEGHVEEADSCVREAISLDPGSDYPRALLAQLLQQEGQFAEAAQTLEKAIELQPNRAKNYFDLVFCRRMTEADRPLLESISALLRKGGLTQDDHRYLHYALGKAYDDLKDYKSAMRHFDEANGSMFLQLSGRPFDRRAHTANFDLTIKTFTKEFFAKHKDAGLETDMPILIVGMIRSGTTLVEQIISSHPTVAAGGELAYLRERARGIVVAGEGVNFAKAREYAEGYLNLLRSISPLAKHVTDKQPLNFMLVGLVHLLFPNARIIHCRRNPLDTCLSMYVTPFPYVVNYGHDLDNIAYFYGEYQRLMAHYRTVIPQDRMLDVDYEELVADREGVSRRMIEFCGLEWDDACLSHEKNPGTIRTPSQWQARQPVYSSSVNRWKNYERWMTPLKKVLEHE